MNIYAGTFVNYNYIDDPLAPARDGFSAGTYANGLPSYIGVGDVVDMGVSNIGARIQIPPESPGAVIGNVAAKLLTFVQGVKI
jgi:hypothetical protein